MTKGDHGMRSAAITPSSVGPVRHYARRLQIADRAVGGDFLAGRLSSMPVASLPAEEASRTCVVEISWMTPAAAWPAEPPRPVSHEWRLRCFSSVPSRFLAQAVEEPGSAQVRSSMQIGQTATSECRPRRCRCFTSV